MVHTLAEIAGSILRTVVAFTKTTARATSTFGRSIIKSSGANQGSLAPLRQASPEPQTLPSIEQPDFAATINAQLHILEQTHNAYAIAAFEKYYDGDAQEQREILESVNLAPQSAVQ